MNPKFLYRCTNCSATYNSGQVIYLCPACQLLNQAGQPPKGVLRIEYDYQNLKRKLKNFRKLQQNHLIDLLPIENLESLPNLRVGNTPLYNISKLQGSALPFRLCLKDDSQNPTFSFKDRASALVSAFAKERGLNTIVAASTGNAGSSLAGICASQGQKAIIMVPQSAPIAKLTQIVMYGATIVPLKGTYDDAFDLSIAATEEFGWYNRNTAFNPITIEGKKTVSFELFEQMGYKAPDRIFVPVGDGVIISGVYKGFEDLMNLGFVEKMPVIVAVQAKGSDNLIRNIDRQDFQITSSQTLADSISVDVPRNFYMAQHFMRQYKGECLGVSDEEILNASRLLARETGIFTEPASAAAFAGMLAYQRLNMLQPNTANVVLLTGSGLKDLKAVADFVAIPNAIDPQIEHLKRFL